MRTFKQCYDMLLHWKVVAYRNWAFLIPTKIASLFDNMCNVTTATELYENIIT